GKLQRVALYLPKQPENVIGMFGAARAGCIFVPVNPLLKPAQIGHILRDCNVQVLVTSPERADGLAQMLSECPDLQHLVLVGGEADTGRLPSRLAISTWSQLLQPAARARGHRVIDTDVVSSCYTSG